MGNKYWFDGGWQWDYCTSALIHIKPHFRCELEPIDREQIDIVIPRPAINVLVNFLDNEGLIKPKMDEKSRLEDLKIVHRVFDILEKEKGKP